MPISRPVVPCSSGKGRGTPNYRCCLHCLAAGPSHGIRMNQISTVSQRQEYFLLVALRDKLRRNEADTTMAKQKIAIACQGGGSQTAFTAGVLSTFFEKGLHLQKQIVSLSGTSGGAVLRPGGLVWATQGCCRGPHPHPEANQGLLGGDHRPADSRIVCGQAWGRMLRLIENGPLPHLELSPVSTPESDFHFLADLLPPTTVLHGLESRPRSPHRLR